MKTASCTFLLSSVWTLSCARTSAAFVNNRSPVFNVKYNRRKLVFVTVNVQKRDRSTLDESRVERMLDSYGEKSRQYRREAFSSADWIYSRRQSRFLDNIKSTFSSGVLRQISVPLKFLAYVSAFVVFYNGILARGWSFGSRKFPALFPWMPSLVLPMAPFTTSMSALGILLGFRTNSSYQRWNEARSAWGRVINDSRSVARLGCIWGKSYRNMDDDSLKRLGEAICSFSRSLMNRVLPPQEDAKAFEEYCKTMITDQRYAKVLMTAKYRPTVALAEISSVLVDFQLNPLHQIQIEGLVSELCGSLGACERLFTSPIPTFYPRNLARFLMFWLMMLPMALYETMSFTWNSMGLIPVMVILATFFLGVEELATQLEEPFSVLPMNRFCEVSIGIPVMEQVERSQKGIQSGNYGPSNPSSAILTNGQLRTVLEQ